MLEMEEKIVVPKATDKISFPTVRSEPTPTNTEKKEEELTG